MPSSFRFGCFELRPDERALLRDGQPLHVGARAFDILLALIERRDRVVEFDELLDVVWPGLAVEENNLSVQISTLRKLLGHDAITTIRGRGYRFTAAADLAGASGQPSESSTSALDPIFPKAAEAAAAQMRMEQAVLPAVAIVPFASPQASESTLGIGDVLADQLISVLSSSSMVSVISRLSTASFRDRATPLPRIATLLSAHFVVSGSCWVSNERLIANVELADTATQTVLWSRTVSDSVEGVLRQDSDAVLELAGAIMQAIFSAEARAAAMKPFPNIATHTMLLSAVDMLYRLSRDDFQRAKLVLSAVRERAPTHPLPMAWLARWHLFRVVQGWSENRDEDGRQARELASRALDIDPCSSLALTMLGNVSTSYLRDLDAAESLYEKATRFNPSESLAWLQWGNARSFRGDGPCAMTYAQRAIRLSPLDPARHFYDSILASSALTAGDYGCAIKAARTSLELNADHVSTHRVLAIALSLSGRMGEARASVDRILELEPDLTVEAFVARSPGAGSGLAHRFAEALQAAGLPSKSITTT